MSKLTIGGHGTSYMIPAILNLVVECSDASVDEVNVATGLAFKELGENKKVVNFARMLFTA